MPRKYIPRNYKCGRIDYILIKKQYFYFLRFKNIIDKIRNNLILKFLKTFGN